MTEDEFNDMYIFVKHSYENKILFKEVEATAIYHLDTYYIHLSYDGTRLGQLTEGGIVVYGPYDKIVYGFFDELATRAKERREIKDIATAQDKLLVERKIKDLEERLWNE